MRERDWTTLAPRFGAALQRDALTVRKRSSGGAVLVSGDLDAAIAALAPGAPMIGQLADLPESSAYALRIARDRALLCSAEPFGARPGWHDGYALSPADDLYAEIEITGDTDGTLAASCMSASPGSPSAMTLFAEHPCLVARAGDTLRVWVPQAAIAEVWARLERLVASV